MIYKRVCYCNKLLYQVPTPSYKNIHYVVYGIEMNKPKIISSQHLVLASFPEKWTMECLVSIENSSSSVRVFFDEHHIPRMLMFCIPENLKMSYHMVFLKKKESLHLARNMSMFKEINIVYEKRKKWKILFILFLYEWFSICLFYHMIYFIVLYTPIVPHTLIVPRTSFEQYSLFEHKYLFVQNILFVQYILYSTLQLYCSHHLYSNLYLYSTFCTINSICSVLIICTVHFICTVYFVQYTSSEQ